MSRKVPLGRLRDISRQRSIRKPRAIGEPDDPLEPAAAGEALLIEWPLRP